EALDHGRRSGGARDVVRRRLGGGLQQDLEQRVVVQCLRHDASKPRALRKRTNSVDTTNAPISPAISAERSLDPLGRSSLNAEGSPTATAAMRRALVRAPSNQARNASGSRGASSNAAAKLVLSSGPSVSAKSRARVWNCSTASSGTQPSVKPCTSAAFA